MSDLSVRINNLKELTLPRLQFEATSHRDLLTSVLGKGSRIKVFGNDGIELVSAPFTVDAGTLANVSSQLTNDRASASSAEVRAQEVKAVSADTQVVFERAKSQALVTGSAVMSFEPGVEAIMREAMADAMLLAKLYADSQTDFDNDPQKWFKLYLKVLDNAGWLVTDALSSQVDQAADAAEVHQAIIALLGVLAAGGPVLALAGSVLSALDNMDKDSPWITLWNKTARRAKFAQMQFGVASAATDEIVEVNLAALRLEALQESEQVLFFKWSRANAKIHGRAQKVLLTRETVLETAPIIRKKLGNIREEFFDTIMNFEVENDKATLKVRK